MPALNLKHPALSVFALCLIVAMAYGGIFHNAFLFDDEFLIVKNSFLRSFDYLGVIFQTSSTAGFGGTDSFFRPLQIFLYLIVYQIFGLSEPAFHGLNLGLHLLNCALVFRLGLALKVETVFAWGAALLWGLHPLHTEAVTYMSATADPLHISFILMGLLCWLGQSPPKIYAGLGCFILALLSKEAAIIFPALALSFAYFLNPKDWTKHALKTWPLWCVAFTYLLLRATLLNFDDSFHFYNEENI